MGIKGKYFMIVSEDSGLALDVRGAGTSPGTEVIMWDKSGNDNQIWYEHPVTGTIRSKHNDLCLDFDSEYTVISDSRIMFVLICLFIRRISQNVAVRFR